MRLRWFIEGRARAFMVLTALAAIVAAATAASGGPSADEKNRSGERVFEQEFPMEPGGRLQIDVDDMDVHVKTAAGGGGSVEIFVAGSNRDKARAFFEKMDFDAYLDKNTLVVFSKNPRHSWSFWNDWRNAQVWAVVSVPRQTDISVETEDGDIRVDELNGEADIQTEDGDLDIPDIRGPSIEVQTSDGDVFAGSLEADEVRVSTSDGDLEIDQIKGEWVSLSSSDGDIRVSRIEADETSVETSDGDVEITVGGDRLDLDCSDGDVTVTLLTGMEADLRTSDGDIELVIPKTVGVDLDLRGERVTVRHKMAIEGTVSKNRIAGSMNDGGPLIRVKTSDGSISVGEGG